MFIRKPNQMDRELLLLEYKAPLMVKAMNIMGYDAANVGWLDLLLSPGLLAGWSALSDFPFLSANIRDREGRLPFTPSVIREFDGFRVGIFGLVSPKKSAEGPAADGAFTVRDPLRTAREVAGELKKTCDLVIALTSLGLEYDEELARQVPAIDVILGGLTRKTLYRARQEGGALVVQAGSKGMRLGNLGLEFVPGDEGPWVLRKEAPEGATRTFTWSPAQLSQRIADHPAITALLEDYRETLKEQQVAGRIASPRATSAFTGVSACRDCHADEAGQWAASRHAAAFATLVRKRQEGNPECLECHVTAYGLDGGFHPGGRSPDLRSVQCEACHGPGQRHQGKTGIRLKVPEQVCQGCHNGENSPTFRYERYLKRLGSHTRGYFRRPADLR
jgi:hypothetical protein